MKLQLVPLFVDVRPRRLVQVLRRLQRPAADGRREPVERSPLRRPPQPQTDRRQRFRQVSAFSGF